MITDVSNMKAEPLDCLIDGGEFLGAPVCLVHSNMFEACYYIFRKNLLLVVYWIQLWNCQEVPDPKTAQQQPTYSGFSFTSLHLPPLFVKCVKNIP